MRERYHVVNMASGDSAIEIIEMNQDRGHIVAENSSPEYEPIEEDVFLPTTPEPKFSKISAQAHSTPRPVGSLTDSDAHLKTNMLANYTTNNIPFDGNMNHEAQTKSGHKLFLFCLALVAMSILAGFFAGYFVREKVSERESNMDDETDPKITLAAEMKKMYHQQAVGNVSDDRIADYVRYVYKSAVPNLFLVVTPFQKPASERDPSQNKITCVTMIQHYNSHLLLNMTLTTNY